MPSLVILVSAVLVLSCGQTNTQSHTQTHIITYTDAAKRFTPATVVSVSKLRPIDNAVTLFKYLHTVLPFIGLSRFDIR